MESGLDHAFSFNEALSFVVRCDTQQELDYFWERLSADPQAEQCGWLKDRFGLPWQIVPTQMETMMASGDAQKIARLTQALLTMKKLDSAALERAFEGR